MTTDPTPPTGKGETLEELVAIRQHGTRGRSLLELRLLIGEAADAIARLRAEVERLTAERDEARDDLRREFDAGQEVAEARRAAEARAARLEEALEEIRTTVLATEGGRAVVIADAALTTEGGEQ